MVDIWKGRTEKVVVEPWLGKRDGARVKVSVGTFFLHSESGSYKPTGKSFALSSEEAREVAAALLAVAEQVDADNDQLEEELILQGKA